VMIRTLFIIAGAGLVLAAACFGGAIALGGSEIMRHGWGQGWGISIREDPWDRDEVIIMPVGPSETRTLDWPGGDRLEIHLPAEATYVQAAETRLQVTGPVELLDRLSLEGGRIGLARSERVALAGRRDRLTVVLSAPDVRRFAVHGSGDLEIRDYDQDRLQVSIHGSGDVTAAGRARELDVSV